MYGEAGSKEAAYYESDENDDSIDLNANMYDTLDAAPDHAYVCAVDDLFVYGVADLESHEALKRSTLYADGTGPYQSESSSGNRLVLIFYFKGYVHAEPLKNTSAVEQADAMEKAITFFIERGHRIGRQVMDNQVSASVTHLLQQRNIPTTKHPISARIAGPASLQQSRTRSVLLQKALHLNEVRSASRLSCRHRVGPTHPSGSSTERHIDTVRRARCARYGV